MSHTIKKGFRFKWFVIRHDSQWDIMGLLDPCSVHTVSCFCTVVAFHFYSSMKNCHLVLDALCNFTIAAYSICVSMLLISINTNQQLVFVEFFSFYFLFVM
jgi:hypothetical protein